MCGEVRVSWGRSAPPHPKWGGALSVPEIIRIPTLLTPKRFLSGVMKFGIIKTHVGGACFYGSTTVPILMVGT